MPEATDLNNGVAQLPAAAWVTLTLPSFGPVTSGHAPKYPNTYRYADQVVASVLEPELLRAWGEAFRRATRDWREAGFDVAYRGTREVQERGSGHYHIIVTVNPNTPEWDGHTPAPVGAELALRINSITSGTAAVPAELRAHIGSQEVLDRRDQLRLPPATRDTLRVAPRLRFGGQKDVQHLNLHSDPKTDQHSFGRKASYASKALSYTVKDLGNLPQELGRRNATHLNRLRLESFALVSDYRVSTTVSRWLRAQLAKRRAAFKETRHRLHERRSDLIIEMAQLSRSLAHVAQISKWDFLDEVTRADLLYERPLQRFFGGRSQKVWLAQQVLQQAELSSIFEVEDLRYLVKNLGVVLRRVVMFHGHTGSAVVSSQWPITATMIREAQRQWALQHILHAASLQGPQPTDEWVPLNEPSRWTSCMAALPPPPKA